MSLDDNFLDSLIRGKAIVLASRIHDKQRIAQALSDHIDREREKRFIQQTMDDHLREVESSAYINWHKLDYPPISPMFDYLGFQKMFWRYFSGLPLRSEETTASQRALEDAAEARRQTRKP